MRKICNLVFFISTFFLLAAGALAQIALDVSLNRGTYLLFEPVYAKIVLRNYSGRTVVFGENEDLKGNLKFVIDMPPGNVSADLREESYNPLVGVVLAAGASEEVIVPVSRLYILNKPGDYRLKAIVTHKQFTSDYQSKTIGFSISNGLPVWERILGVPDVLLENNSSDKIPARTARIVRFGDGTKRVYALVIEDKKYVYGVIRIGYDIGNSPPQCEVDALSKIHIMLQAGPKIFSYFVYDVNAGLDEKEVYVKTNVPPTLVRNPENGTVIVAGGKKAVINVDYVEEQDGTPFLKED